MKAFSLAVKTTTRSQYIFGSAVVLMLALSFSGCSKIQVSEVAKIDSSVAAGLPQNPQTLSSACAEAKTSGRLRTKLLTASYPDTGKACDWNQNGNLSQLNQFIRARHEQRQVFQVAHIADGKVSICHIKLASSGDSRFYYDDNVFITLNNYILASTSNFTRHLEAVNGFFRYDWNHLINKPAQNSGADTVLSQQYCAGAAAGQSACEFPQTETAGTAKLHFGETVIQNILSITNASQFELGVITTGDDDLTDCQHVPINLNLDVAYIVE